MKIVFQSLLYRLVIKQTICINPYDFDELSFLLNKSIHIK